MDGYVTIGTELDTKSFDAQIDYVKSQLDEIEHKLQQADMGFEVGDTQKLEAQYEILTEKLRKLVEKKEQLNKTDFSGIKGAIDNIGNSVEKVITKVSRWALAIFGIRSMYLGIRQAMSQLSQEDNNLKYQVEYIKYVLANAIKPVIEWIVKLIYKILTIFGGIIKLLFGINIFSKKTADGFKKAQLNANKLKKTLASFDEMNVLGGGNNNLASDINNALGQLGDLEGEVDRVANRIKEMLDGIKHWFMGDNATIGEAIKNAIIGIPTTLKQALQPAYDRIIYPYLIKPLIEGFDFIKEASRPIWEPIVDAFKLTIDTLKPMWDSFKDYLGNKIEQLRPIWEPIKEKFVDFKNSLLKQFAPALNTIIGWINDAFGWMGIHLDYIETDVEETMDNIGQDVQQTANELNNTPITLKIYADMQNAYNSTKNWLSDLKDKFSNWWDNTKQYLGFSKGGVIYNSKGAIYYPPKLAVGGIINRPSRGVPIGSAIGGEAGAEGVIPLTDSQQMELLGEAIGRYISINLTNITELDGRQIARKVDKVRNNQNFVMNR